MQKLSYVYIVFLLLSTLSYSQSTISSSGTSVSSSDISLDYVIGQIAITAIQKEDIALHQGVLQGLKIEALEKKSEKKLDLSIWPNPTSRMFTIATKDSGIHYALFNSLQQKTSCQGYIQSNSQKTVDIHQLQAATYLLHLTDETGNTNIYKILKIN